MSPEELEDFNAWKGNHLAQYREALDMLNGHVRDRLEPMTLVEIAALRGTTHQTVGNVLHRAIRKMRIAARIRGQRCYCELFADQCSALMLDELV